MEKVFIRTIIKTPETKIYTKVKEIEEGIQTIREAIREIENVQAGLTIISNTSTKQETKENECNEYFCFSQQIDKEAIEEQLNNIFELKEMLKEETEKLNKALVYEITKV